MSVENVSPCMYFVVNGDLKMTPGKMAAQVAHAAVAVVESNPKNDAYHQWRRDGHAKIVLVASYDTIKALGEKYAHCSETIIDAGRTQVPPESTTVIGFHVCFKGTIPELNTLKLHK